MSRADGEWFIRAWRKLALTAPRRKRKRIVGEHKAIATLADFPYDFVSAKVRKSLAAIVESSIVRMKVIKGSLTNEIVRFTLSRHQNAC